MNKPELITEISNKTALNKNDAEKVLNAFVDIVKYTLASGDKIGITGFGTFEVVERAARTGRNPHDGSAIEIPASKAPKFKASKTLKDAVKA